MDRTRVWRVPAINGTIGLSVWNPLKNSFSKLATYSINFILACIKGESTCFLSRRNCFPSPLASCFDFGSFSMYLMNFIKAGHIWSARLRHVSFSHQRWPQYGNGCVLVSVIFSNVFLLAGVSWRTPFIALRVLPRHQSVDFSPVCMLPCTICRPQVPMFNRDGFSLKLRFSS